MMDPTTVPILEALRVTHALHSAPADRRRAQEFLIQLEQSLTPHITAFALLRLPNQTPEAQHFGFQLLGAGLRRSWDKWQDSEKNDAKQLLISCLGPVSEMANYVRVKFAAAFVECVKREWPQRWGNLMPVLIGGAGALPGGPGAGVTPACKPGIALLILRLLADALGDDSTSHVDLPIKRKKELVAAFVNLREDIFRFMGGACGMNAVDTVEQVLFVRSVIPIFGLTSLLEKRLDEQLLAWFEQASSTSSTIGGGGSLSVREEVVLTFAEVSTTSLYKYKRGGQHHPDPTKEDVLRLTQNLTRLVSVCVQSAMVPALAPGASGELDEEDCGLHRQLAAILRDFVATNAQNLHDQQAHDSVGVLWDCCASILARYPSYYVASEALLGMRTLAKSYKQLPAFLNLDQLVELSLLRMCRVDKMVHPEIVNNALHPTIAHCLRDLGGRQWVFRLLQTKKIEADLADVTENSEFGMLKNNVYMVLQTLAEVGGEQFFVPLTQRVRTLLKTVLTTPEPVPPGGTGGVKNDTPSQKQLCLEATLGLLSRLTSYTVAKMNTALKAEKKKQEEGRSSRSGPPTHPNLVADPGNCVESALAVVEDLVTYEFYEPGFDDEESPAWIKLEIARLEFIATVSTVYPLRPHVMTPILNYLFSRIESGSKLVCGLALHKHILTCLTTICKNGRTAVIAHLDALIQKAEQTFQLLSKNNQQLMMQALIAAASSDAQKQTEIVEKVVRSRVEEWCSPHARALIENQNNLLRYAFVPSKTAVAKEEYFKDAKFLCKTLNSFIMVLKYTSATASDSPYIIKEDASATRQPTAVGGTSNGGPPPGGYPPSGARATGAAVHLSGSPELREGSILPVNITIVDRPNPAARVVKEITPGIVTLLASLFRAFPTNWLNAAALQSSKIAGEEMLPLAHRVWLDESEYLMVCGHGRANTGSGDPKAVTAEISQLINAVYATEGSLRDEYSREVHTWAFTLRFSAIRALASCVEAADGFWDVPGILDTLSDLMDVMFPLMSPHHVDFFFKTVVANLIASFEGRDKVLSVVAAAKVCESRLFPTLFRNAKQTMDAYWGFVLNSGDEQQQSVNGVTVHPNLFPVIATSLLTLTRTVSGCLTRLLTCGFGGSHSQHMVEVDKVVEPRPVAWLDFVFRTPATHLAVRDGCVGILNYPDPDSLQKITAALRLYCTQLWTTGVAYHCLSLSTAEKAGIQPKQITLPPQQVAQRAAEVLGTLPACVGRAVLQTTLTPRTTLSEALIPLLQKRHTVAMSETVVNGKLQPSQFVSHLALLFAVFLQTLDKQFKLNCRILNVSPDVLKNQSQIANLLQNTSPPLWETFALLTEFFRSGGINNPTPAGGGSSLAGGGSVVRQSGSTGSPVDAAPEQRAHRIFTAVLSDEIEQAMQQEAGPLTDSCAIATQQLELMEAKKNVVKAAFREVSPKVGQTLGPDAAVLVKNLAGDGMVAGGQHQDPEVAMPDLFGLI